MGDWTGSGALLTAVVACEYRCCSIGLLNHRCHNASAAKIWHMHDFMYASFPMCSFQLGLLTQRLERQMIYKDVELNFGWLSTSDLGYALYLKRYEPWRVRAFLM